MAGMLSDLSTPVACRPPPYFTSYFLYQCLDAFVCVCVCVSVCLHTIYCILKTLFFHANGIFIPIIRIILFIYV